MEKREEENNINKSESEEDLDDTELLDDKPIKPKEEQAPLKRTITPNVNIEKILELRKKFRDKEFLVKGIPRF